ncbi:retropepsin-like aspartic protease family protein [Haliea sp. E17]|uniref:retropepsin-like aspartic protease family protein n=1 Tax=Haliea sp. E17 TaxID=3401576 RepID=UPI003AABFB8A
MQTGQQPDGIRTQKRMGVGMMVMAWVLVLGFGAWFFSGLLERQFNPNTSLVTTENAGGVREVTLKRNKYGHYVTSGAINGTPVTFMLDTGATGVAIPVALAERMRLSRGRAFQSQTANGTTLSYATRLDSVAVGGIELADVPASIVTGLEMNQVLLGMTFLKHIEFSQRGDTLTLRQYPDQVNLSRN